MLAPSTAAISGFLMSLERVMECSVSSRVHGEIVRTIESAPYGSLKVCGAVLPGSAIVS